MLQVRITENDGSNPVILERAKNRSLSKTINSADEGISFEIAKNDSKAEVLNPDIDGYKKFWEAWDTVTNERLNYGPITSITEQGANWKVEGRGRSALLADFYKTKKTFYASISATVDDLRFENLAVQPRTQTLIASTEESTAQATVFGAALGINEKYHGLSKGTKDNAIDDDTGLLKPGEIEPPNTFYTTDSFWSGMSRADSLIVDLGQVYDVSRVSVSLPSWGGPSRLYNRSYDFDIAYATPTDGSITTLQGRDFGTFTSLYGTPAPNRALGGESFYVGKDSSNTLVVSPGYVAGLSPVSMRYLRTEISSTHAWYGTHFDDDPSVDGWEFQCDTNYDGGISGLSAPGAMDKEINTRTLEAANDCHASIKEIGIYKEIIGRDNISLLGLQRIDNNNFQIRYWHTPDADETKTTKNGYRKFEPGGFFRRVTLEWSGANTTYTKFYDDDCSNCFPDGFRLGVMDQDNNLVIATDDSSGTTSRTLGAYTRHLTIKGSSNATVTSVDSWPARTDAFSWGGSYSYTDTAGDFCTIHFRGQSFKWYATVPSHRTGANVTVSIRQKDDNTGAWSSFSTLSTFTLPNDIASESVYEITYESGQLQAGIIYEIKIENNDGGFCSIDSIEGYWSASMVEYNEDSSRVTVSRPERFKQIYDKRFSGGSMYKITHAAYSGFAFQGDRVIITSAKGRNHGRAKILLMDRSLGGLYDPGTSNHVFIPGGDPVDGSLTVDLDTGKRGNEITQFIMFDSNDYFPGGLPWGLYSVWVFLRQSDIETYSSSIADVDFDSFVPRCQDCEPSEGETIQVRKPIYIDSIFAHELIGLSVQYINETHLDILQSLAEALQVEWDITEAGLRFEPRIGQDTDILLREGENTLVDWQIVNDIQQMATMLLSSGSDIDGLPLFTITEDKKTRKDIGRTIMRQHDFRNIADYFQLIGLSRTELKKRARPQKRVSISHIADTLDLEPGDSFLLWTEKMGTVRVRINRKARIESSSGRTFDLECVTWPQII